MKKFIITISILGALGTMPRSLLAQENVSQSSSIQLKERGKEASISTYVNLNSTWEWGNGSKQRPSLSISDGIEKAPEGAVISIAEGTYRESLDISKPITLVATEGEVRIEAGSTFKEAALEESLDSENRFSFGPSSDQPLTVFPNPIDSEAEIRFTLQEKADIQLQIFSPEGRQVATVFQGKQGRGVHSFQWDGRDGNGTMLSAGIYILRLSTGSKIETFSIMKR